jgi:hypothetical protein
LAAFVRAAADDENVLGLVLGGSRGKGAHITNESDWDVYVVVQQLPADWQFARGGLIEPFVLTLDGLREMRDWNRYAFAHVEPVIDKTGGEIGRVVAGLGRRDTATADPLLDGYVNFYYRSLKNHVLGLQLESHLDAAESIAWWLDFLFASHGRVRPYNKWLRWELSVHPLDEPWSEQNVVPRLSRIVATGGIDDQRALFRATEAFARDRGLARVIDGWEPDVAFLRGEVPG